MHQEVRQRGQHAVALSDAEEKKFAKYEDKCREAGLLFTPLAFEVFGGHGNHCRQLLSRLADACAIRNNYPRSITKCRLRQLISIAIQRGNATALLRRDPREYALPGAYYEAHIYIVRFLLFKFKNLGYLDRVCSRLAASSHL